MLASETGGCLVEVARHPLTLEPFKPSGTKQDNTNTQSCRLGSNTKDAITVVGGWKMDEVVVRLAGVCSGLQSLRDSLRGVRHGRPGCWDQAGNTPLIYLHLIPKESLQASPVGANTIPEGALIEMISILLSRLMMDELAAAGTFDKPLSAVTAGTE
ncbi:hypothetical protein NQZ68_013321 [Dissostichus eleginoides]|nr:hypothetical protein NQZ68_013321 [Dissostichus eleginoides]